ncbi:MAG: hypothetical protein U0270_24905 [Labilithrix sp.]
MTAGRSALLAASLLGVAACSLLTDLDELHGGSGDAGGGASGSPEGAAPDAGGGDATGGDGAGTSSSGTLTDGGLDCSGATFCDGFERDAFQGAWPDFSLTKASKLSIARDRARSGSSSLRCALTASEAVAAMLIMDLAAAKAIELRYAFWVDSAVRQTNMWGLAFIDGSTQRTLFLKIADGKATYADELIVGGVVKSESESDAVDVPLGRWVEVAVFLDVAARLGRAELDGKVLVDAYSVGDLPTDAAKLFGGVSYAAAGPAYDIYVDDVRLTVTRK